MGRVVGAGLAAICLVGCAPRTRQFEPAANPRQLSDMQYLHYMETVPVATFEEGCRAMIMAADGADPYDSHVDRYAELRSRGIVRDAWRLEADHVLDHGTLCFMMAEIGDLPCSVNSTLFGSWGLGDRRYAARRVAAEGLLRAAPTYQPVTGGELVWAAARLDEWMAAEGMYELTAAWE